MILTCLFRFQELQKENYELRVSVQAQSDLMENNRNDHGRCRHSSISQIFLHEAYLS